MGPNMKHLKLFYHLLKCALIKFVLVAFLISSASYASEIIAEYSVSTSGIKIGKFTWSLNINNGNYETKIFLKNSGLFSPLYKFKGEYISRGEVKNDYFNTKYYRQYWETNKLTKIIEMTFVEKLNELVQEPKEKEHARINLNDLFGYNDPIVSFVNILKGNDSIKTIDGRRIYVMKKKIEKNADKIVVEINDYQNIWADHKRNDLNKIEFILEKENFLPTKINIFFKDRIFRLLKN